MVAKPTMNLAGLRFDRTAHVIDGRIKIDNVNVVNVPGGKAAIEGLRAGAFDAAEVPFARFVSWIHSGVKLKAVPVFTDRLFQHEYIFTPTDTDIADLSDLRGRRVICAPSYFATPSFWHRALLKDEGGVEPYEIEWHSPAAEAPEMHLPGNVLVKHSAASILGLERLLDGTADALMTARTPMFPPGQEGRIRRVLVDANERRRAWFKRTGFFPILHVIAIRDEALKSRPGLGEDICRAYDAAKQYAYDLLQDDRMTGLPLMRGYLDDAMAMGGADPWPYGIERNRAEIERFLDLARGRAHRRAREHRGVIRPAGGRLRLHRAHDARVHYRHCGRRLGAGIGPAPSARGSFASTVSSRSRCASPRTQLETCEHMRRTRRCLNICAVTVKVNHFPARGQPDVASVGCGIRRSSGCAIWS